MAKNKTDNFLIKFANRVETVGRDGVMGLMKSTGVPINNNRQNNYSNQGAYFSMKKEVFNEDNKNTNDFNNHQRISPNNLFTNNNTYRNLISTNSNKIENIYKSENKFNKSSKSLFPTINNHNQNYITENIHNHFRTNNNNDNLGNPLFYSNKTINNENNLNNNNKNYFNSRSNVRSNSLNVRFYDNNNNNLIGQKFNNDINQRNIYSVANNRQNIVDYGYTPYTLKDYKKITNDVKLGKLGPNIGTEEWNKKRKRMKKMSDYGNKVMSEGKGCYAKLAESADDKHKRLKEMKLLNGKWNIINEYSRGIMLNTNKNSNERFKKNVNDKLMEEERLIDKQFEMDLEDEEEKERILQQKRNEVYQQRLNRMKNLLFN